MKIVPDSDAAEVADYPPHALGRSAQPVNTDFNRLVYCLMGMPIDALSVRQAILKLHGAVRRQDRCFLSTPNVNFLMASLTDQDFRHSVIRSDICVADGMPLVWMARLLGIPVKERVAGSTLFEHLGAAPEAQAVRVYFFGGPSGAAESAADAVNAQYRGIRCVGHASPGFGTIEEMSDAATLASINQSKPDFLIVALGAKKGQRWIEHNLAALSAPVVSHLGAVINMAAGTITRAPLWLQRAGLEWAWRIKEEPSLWRRYLGDGMGMVKLLLRHFLPSLYYQRIYRHALPASRASVHTQHAVDACKITLDGTWSDSGLTPLRKALAQATVQPCDIELDLGAVTYGDSGFIALLILLYGHQLRSGKKFIVTDVSAPMRQILRANCAAYLLMP